jgi:hypothetical protein
MAMASVFGKNKSFGHERPLPGSLLLATKIERRRFLRNSASTLFYGAVLTSSGAMTLGTFLASPASAQTGGGGCCPSCCGPSPCCGTSCCNKQCCSGATCNATKDGTCLGRDTTWGSLNGCWSCPSQCGGSTNTCCDCRINNTDGCKNNVNRCICVG